MRGFRAVMLCSCLWVACISDLKPEVGPLAASDQDVGDIGNDEGGESNGSSSASGGNGASGANAGNGNSETEAGSDDPSDAALPGTTGGNDAGANGPPPGGCNVQDSDGSKDISFAKQIRPILTGCRCHDPEDLDPFAILESGLTIADYKTLRKGGDNTGAKIIVDGNACDSIILQKLSEMPPFGDRMPRDGPYLSIAERTLISDWIVEGARDN